MKPPKQLPIRLFDFTSHNLKTTKRITVELTGRGDYIQPSIQTIKLRNALSALRSNDLFGVAIVVSYYFFGCEFLK
jgi:hypothetical protein